MYKLALIFYLFLITIPCPAQESTAVQEVEINQDEDADENESPGLPSDTFAYIHEKPLPVDSIASILRSKDFAYMQKLDSMLRKKQHEEKKEIKRNVNRTSALSRFFGSPALVVVLWLLAAIFIVMILYHIFLNNVFFRKKGIQVVREEITEADHFYEDDYDALIRQSCLVGDYRMAVRYWYLKVLRQLAEKERVDYDTAKTNSQYAREVPETMRKEFIKLLTIFETTWYGHAPVDKEKYHLAETAFISFYKNTN